jgi:30S ribosomal protein 3
MSKFVLKVLWLEKSLGIALDQRVGKSTQPVTEYFFWPRKDAWDELKDRLNSYSWVSQAEAISLLNQTTDLIQAWQEEDEKDSFQKLQAKFPDTIFLGHD